MDPDIQKVDVQFDPHQCNFGKWFYGEGSVGTEKIAPYFTKSLAGMEEPHTKLHQSAEKLNELMQKGDKKGCWLYTFRQRTRISQSSLTSRQGIKKDYPS